jgi:hypothetical protein
MITLDYFGAERAKKIFSLSFPARQGTGEATLPLPGVRPFGAAATGSAALARSPRIIRPPMIAQHPRG